MYLNQTFVVFSCFLNYTILTLSDPGYFRQLTIRGGGALKAPPPLRSRKLLRQSSPYHTCEFYQVFLTLSNWNFSKIRDFDHFTAISK